jgi:flagellin-like protein
MERMHERKRGVMPVIGVILMVAMTVILAAVIAGYATNLGNGIGTDEARAGVSIDVNDDADRIEIRVTTLGTADHVNVTGDPYDHHDGGGPLGSRDELRELSVGDEVTIESSDLEPAGRAGTVAVVAVDDGTETMVTSAEYDFG